MSDNLQCLRSLLLLKFVFIDFSCNNIKTYNLNKTSTRFYVKMENRYRAFHKLNLNGQNALNELNALNDLHGWESYLEQLTLMHKFH